MHNKSVLQQFVAAFRGVLFFFLLLPAAHAEVSGILINADSMSRDSVREVIELEGHVNLVFRDQHLSADKATVYPQKKEVVATGNVKVSNLKLYMEGSKVHFNYDTNTGTIYDAFVQSGQVLFEGPVIEKTGPETFVAYKANYTACTNCPPSWSFSGEKIEAEIGGYAKINYPVLHVLGLPILPLGYMVVPFKSERQTGLLVPSWSTSHRGGFAIDQGFFWALSPSRDMTLTARNYQNLGLKGLADYRYLLSADSGGKFSGAYMKDRDFNTTYSSPDLHRWFLDYNHYYLLPDDFVNRVKITTVSDLHYTQDFPEELKGNGDPAIENRFSITKNTRSVHSSLEAAYYLNLLKQDPLSNNADAVHRAPEIRTSLVDQSVWGTPLLFRMDFDYVNFARSGFGYDNVDCSGLPTYPCRIKTDGPFTQNGTRQVFTGSFQEGDLIRAGQRVDLQPQLAYPFKLGEFDFLPTANLRQTLYVFDVKPGTSSIESTAGRRYLETGLNVKTRFSRIFGDLDSEKATRWKHEIEPSVTYSEIPWIQQPNHYFFGDLNDLPYAQSFEPVNDKDFYGPNRVQFDYNDRVVERRLADIGITNRLIRRRWDGESAQYKNIATLRVSQSYDFRAAENMNSQPLSALNGLLDVRLDSFETNTTSSYYPYAGVTNTTSRVKFIHSKSEYVQLSYARNYLIDVNNQVVDGSKSENYGLGLGFKSQHLDLVGELNYSVETASLQSWQYKATFKGPGDCWAIAINHGKVIGGEAVLSFNFNFNFGGTPPSAL